MMTVSYVQWNPSITATIGTRIFGRFRGVAANRGSKVTCTFNYLVIAVGDGIIACSKLRFGKRTRIWHLLDNIDLLSTVCCTFPARS